MYFCCNFNIIVVWPEISSKCRTDFLPRTTPTLGPNRMLVSSAQFLDFQATRLCSFLIILMGRSEEFSFFCSACRAWKSFQSKQNELDFCSEVLNSEVKCLVWACPHFSVCVSYLTHCWMWLPLHSGSVVVKNSWLTPPVTGCEATTRVSTDPVNHMLAVETENIFSFWKPVKPLRHMMELSTYV